MATAIEYFKLLPKTNCKDCGQPTCLAFAMLLANQKAKLEDCPHVSGEAVEAMKESSAPPVNTVKVGTGENAVAMGGENVLYRHERRFENPIAYAVSVSDSWDAPRIAEAVAKAKSLAFDRVGMVFRLDLVSVSNDSGESDEFLAAVDAVLADWDLPIMFEINDVGVAEAALSRHAALKPLVYAGETADVEAFAKLATKHGCPLGIRAKGVEAAADAAEIAAKAGCKDLVLDLGASNLKECLEWQTIARRAAINRKFRPLGHPLMNRVGCGEYAVATAVLSTLKYGSLVVFDGLEPYEALPLFTLRQNIYTDPQVPIQVKQDLYPIGDPGPHSPIMFTTNFSLTYFTVRADIEKSKIPVWLQIVNTEGLSVLTAYSAGKFEPERVAAAFEESGVLDKSDGPVVVPGLVARMSGKLSEEIGRDVVVGTNESKDIPKHLREITS
ncbi:MAG: acetyl-CoA decarbonylase/synthase complex subunit gamma [Thermoplasmatales archaeon]|nr:acetyl-CoA decarbonylase/synthase complex subunit gamma [Thermoplasmatales archaeon]